MRMSSKRLFEDCVVVLIDYERLHLFNNFLRNNPYFCHVMGNRLVKLFLIAFSSGAKTGEGTTSSKLVS